ncbi:MAG: hypothetical protein ABIT58_10710 [Ferruginibacter sp.]
MKIFIIVLSIFLAFFVGCKQKEQKLSAQHKFNIHLPTKSANVVFHIKDNKVTSYEILNADGSAMTEPVIYRSLNETGEESCYRCAAGVTDMKNCTKIPCPPDPCKEIYCGPLNFQINDMTSSTPGEESQFTIVADGVKQ